MKKSIGKIFLGIVFFVSLMICYFVQPTTASVSFAEQSLGDSPQNTETTDVSIFIRKPSYSVFYDNKIYFIDEVDKLLKVYDKSSESFLSTYCDLSDYNIVDVSFLDKYLYLMTTNEINNQIHKIDLDTLILTNLDVEIANTEEYIYHTFFAQNLSFESKTYTLFSISGFRLSPKLVVLDNETGEIDNNFDLSFEGTIFSGFESNLTKVLSYQQSNGSAYIIFVYSKNIALYQFDSIDSLIDLKDNSISSLYQMEIPLDQSRLSSDENIIEVGFATIDTKDYLAIFFNNNLTNSNFLRLYSFDFKSQTNTIAYIAEFSCSNAQYSMLNQNYFVFPNDVEQQIHYNLIKDIDDSDAVVLHAYGDFVDNPDKTIDYFDFSLETDESSNYKVTNKTTYLFADPWGAHSDVEIPEGYDVVKIGNVILENNVVVNDYVYCMFSYAGQNHCGFIPSSDLDNKSVISLSETNYKPRVKVWPKTRLYSLPTTITAGNIGSSNLSSHVIMEISDNYELEVLDVICAYVANNSRMIKVRVNGDKIGYIEEKSIRNPVNVVEFVITNATIQKDATIVYHSASKDSSHLTFTLNKGKNVRINGNRNTSTGWTSITFNDEFGNEFTGYVETDFIKADEWSTLQIIGCVLIAVNVGLLILILIYKKNHLGRNGNKIITENVNEEN